MERGTILVAEGDEERIVDCLWDYPLGALPGAHAEEPSRLSFVMEPENDLLLL